MPENILLPTAKATALTPAQLRLLRGVSRSFYLSIRLLPGPLRGPIAIGYLLARATDTVADTTALPRAERQTLLAQLLAAIEKPQTATQELKAALTRFAAQQSDPHERALMLALPEGLSLLQTLSPTDQTSVRWVLGHITQGQTLDVSRFGSGPQALATEAELEDYTWLVAGCVGEFWTALCARHLPGFAALPTDEMHALGRAYGMGLQRLNIVRDAGADLAQGRCYWPAQQLNALGLSPESLTQAVLEGQAHTLAQLTPLYQSYLQQIQTQLAAGLRYSCAVQSRRLRLASALPALIGARTVALLLQAGPASLTQRVKMPRREVQGLLWRLLLRGVSVQALSREFERLSAQTAHSSRRTPMRESQPMSPQDYVQQKAAASGSSFYYAFLFLPAERRAAITAFYAFCREVDDVVDEIKDPSVAAAKLGWWQKEVLQAYAGQPTHPVMHALMPLAPTYGIESHHLMAVIEGCQMDLNQTRYLDFAGLTQYCHLVASVVGEVAARIFGQTDEATTAYAHKLGLAFQMTNIIRDVGEDAMRGRIYLPLDEQQRFGVKANELMQRDYSDRFIALMKFQTERAHALYDEALALLPAADRRAQKPGLMMASIYRTLLREIEASGYQVLHQRIALTPLRKLWLAWKMQALGRF